MGCPLDHKVPNLHPGHPIFTIMALTYFWVLQILSLESEVPQSRTDTSNKMQCISSMADLFSTAMTLFPSSMTLAINYAHVVQYQFRRWPTLSPSTYLQLHDKLLDYIVQWVGMCDIPSMEDRCTKVNINPPPHHASIDRSCPLQNIDVHSRGGGGADKMSQHLILLMVIYCPIGPCYINV